jgi:hypothetical protein
MEYGIFPAVGALPELSLNIEGAWEVTSYAQLFTMPELVGEDNVVPGVDGRDPVPDELEEGVYGLPFFIYGFKAFDGSSHPDARIGLRNNLRYLRTSLWTPPGTADGTRPFEFHDLDGLSVATGDVKVRPGEWGFPGPTLARVTIRLIVPAGILS